MSLTTTVKKTITVDSDVWNEFKHNIKRRYSGTMILSKAVEEAINNYNTAKLLKDAAKALNVEIREYPSSTEVETTRPLAEGTSRLVREMRDAAAR